MRLSIILYSEINLLCITLLLFVFLRDAKQRNNDTHHVLFTRVLFSSMIFCASDILWGITALGKGVPNWINWAINVMYFSLSGVCGYFWLDFVEETIGISHKRKVTVTLLRLLPPIALTVMSVLSVKTHWLFYIDESGQYQRGILYILQPILAYILPTYATVRALIAMRKTQNLEKKHQCRSAATFYVFPFIGGILQILIAGTPMLNVGIALAGLQICFSFQDSLIMLDPLTSMNNRRCFDRNLDKMIRGREEQPGKQMWLVMMDIDYFKKINDGFGHAEGDRALIIVANSIKRLALDNNCVAARIGGDEFAMCFESDDDRFPDRICTSIESSLDKDSMTLPFKLKMSMGRAVYNEGMTAQQLYVAADHELYEAKNAR